MVKNAIAVIDVWGIVIHLAWWCMTQGKDIHPQRLYNSLPKTR